MNDNICKIFLEREKNTLSPYAFLTANTRGRDLPYTPCPNRTEFQRDRDKIIHSKAFRRLMHKTQVFLLPSDEHYRTRMTHTLEVSQIARIIARALLLNEDLCEAISLGHDLGHTPFGHAGEYAMRDLYDKSFTHAAQGVRVVERLEGDGEGLNLTYEVRDGIKNHTGGDRAETLEGRLVRYADRIAYINHDIDDALRAGILAANDIPRSISSLLGTTNSQRINRMVTDIIENSKDSSEIIMSDEIGGAMNELREFLFAKVYTSPVAKAEEGKAGNLLAMLFEHYMENPSQMPRLYADIAEKEGTKRGVCDFISSMTDRYAIDLFRDIFVPEGWKRANI